MIKIEIENLIFDCRVSGNEEDELVILLHGFPESSFMYRELMKDLSELGYYCMAPNMRGYSPGARPSGKSNYTIDKLSSDIMDIANYVGREKFHLIGHDWGSVIGWQIVHDNPDAILSWTGLSVPHTQSFFEALLNDNDQKKRSKYIKLFQIPVLPELKIKSKNFKILREMWDAHSKEEVEDYLSILNGNKALTATLNYYRASSELTKKAKTRKILGNIDVPTLFIWGKNDVAIGAESVKNGHKYMKSEYTFLELESGHWLIQSSYSEVKPAIIKHLSKHKSDFM